MGLWAAGGSTNISGVHSGHAPVQHSHTLFKSPETVQQQHMQNKMRGAIHRKHFFFFLFICFSYATKVTKT